MNERQNELVAEDRMALQDILVKNPAALTDDERAHLRARAIYLTDEEIQKFGLKTESSSSKPARRGRSKAESKEDEPVEE